MDDLRDTSRQLIPNLGEGFKQFMTSRVIRGIKIFLQSTWSYKNIQKTMFRLEISRILTKFIKNWVEIFMILRQERYTIPFVYSIKQT